MGSVRVGLDAYALRNPLTGVGTMVHQTLVGLARSDDIEVVAYGWSPGNRESFRRLLPPGVEPARLPMLGAPMRAAWNYVGFPPIEMWTGKIDVVHGPNFVVPPALHATRLITIHDLTFLRYPELCTDAALKYPALIKRAIAKGAWIHTVSKFVANEVVEMLGVHPDRVVTVPNGVVTVTDADPSMGRLIAGTDRYILALGTIEPRKDLPTLVKAFDTVGSIDPDVRLVVAGPRGWGYDAFMDSVERCRYQDRIVCPGWVTDEQRAALLRGASLLAYPSIYEGFGLPPLEAMSVGTPVVATRAGAIPEVVGDAAILVEPSDQVALSEAILKILLDDTLTSSLRSNGYKRAAMYSWADTAGALASLYKRLASS